MSRIQEEKRALRKAMHEKQRQFCALSSRKVEASAAACKAVAEYPAYKEADTILAYMAMPEEADCSSLIEDALASGKRVAIPRIRPGTCDMDFFILEKGKPLTEQTETGPWNIQEPRTTLPVLEPEDAQGAVCMIVPGVAFTQAGARLGHGKGFYDRYISRLQKSRARILLCGFCFSVQCTDSVPTESCDVPMDALATEHGICACHSPQ
ncbi:MAG: 5-formyltetrahydrofolate cyclo-ligase [Treponema sp.]|nr:5-formyltetrahydrofolate cyclo-ligase [Treponema sp.]